MPGTEQLFTSPVHRRSRGRCWLIVTRTHSVIEAKVPMPQLWSTRLWYTIINDMIRKTDHMTKLNCEWPSTDSISCLVEDVVQELAEDGALRPVEVATAIFCSSLRAMSKKSARQGRYALLLTAAGVLHAWCLLSVPCCSEDAVTVRVKAWGKSLNASIGRRSPIADQRKIENWRNGGKRRSGGTRCCCGGGRINCWPRTIG